MNIFKKIGVLGAVAAAAFVLSITGVAAESIQYTEANEYPTELPQAEITQMTKTEIDDFFGNWKDEDTAYYKNLYSSLVDYYEKNSQFDYGNNIYGMKFTAKDKEIDSGNKYGSYHADFVLTASEDTAVILIGNYGEYGTVMLPVQVLSSNNSIRVMECASELLGAISYNYVVNKVGTFECVAIPVTDELISVMGDDAKTYLGDITDCPTKAETTLSLQLRLFEMANIKINENTSSWQETGTYWNIGNKSEFTYHGTIDGQLLAVTGMQSEDSGYPIGIYAAVDSLKYKKVGFEVKAECGNLNETKNIETDTVYESVKVGDETINASDLDGKYIFGGTLLFNKNGSWTNDTKITVIPFIEFSDGTQVEFEKNSAEIKSQENAPLFGITENKEN